MFIMDRNFPRLSTELIRLTLLISIIKESVCDDYTIRPVDMVGQLGDTITLICRVNDTSGPFIWDRVNPFLRIYTEKDGVIADKNKYAVQEPHDLQIKEVTFQDAHTYRSSVVYSGTGTVDVYVLIFGSDMAIQDIQLTENVTTNVTCLTSFNLPPGLVPSEYLDTIFLVNDRILSLDQINFNQIDGANHYKMNGTALYTPSLADNGTVIECIITTATSPPYNITVNKTIEDIRYGPRHISFHHSSNNSILMVGDSIICSAEGNPLPDEVWKPVDSPMDENIINDVLVIDQRMCGNITNSTEYVNNTWRCTANNSVLDVDGNPIIASETITFQIDGPSCFNPPVEPTPSTPDPSPTTKEPGLTKGAKIGIGCGVGGGVVVIVAIVLGVCCHRQKKKRKRTMSTEGSDGVVNPAVTYTTGDDDDGMIQPYGVVGAHSRGKTEADAFRPQSGLHYASAGLKVQDTAGPPVTSEYSLAKELPKADPNAVYSDVRKPRGEYDTTMWDNTTYVPYNASRDEHPGPQDGPRTVWNVGGEGLKSDQPPTNNQQEIPAPDYV